MAIHASSGSDLKNYVLVITGNPGVGKSTLFNKIVEKLRSLGYSVGGFITIEERDDKGNRKGFKMIDLLTGEWSWLALRGYPSHITVGSYGVVEEASRLAVKALSKESLEKVDVVGIDEIGPMELKLPGFKESLRNVFELSKPIIAVVHFRLSDPEILSKLAMAERVILTPDSRDNVTRDLLRRLEDKIKNVK